MAAVAPIAMPAIAPPEMEEESDWDCGLMFWCWGLDVEREVEVAEMVAVGSDDDRAVLAA
jgi:hypothetical protein